MTAPNQAYPSLLQTVGLGAFEVGGTGGGSGSATNYGQDITSEIVTTLINGPAAAMLSGANLVTDIADVLTNLSTYLSTMPLEALQVFEGFLPGTVAADFADIETAVATIVSNLGLGNMGVALGEFSAWLSSTFAPLVTLVQQFLDAIANALGHSGVGHLVTQIETYLGAIPNANVTAILGSSNLGADVQAIVDKLANGLGQSGTNHTLANLLSYMGAIPPANVTSVVSGGTNLAADVQGIVDNLANGLGFTGTGHTLANLLAYIEAIPPTNVTSVLGGSSLASDITGLFGGISSFVGVDSTVTSGGTTTLTSGSNATQTFTGYTTQTVVLPASGTVGMSFRIVDQSSGAITVEASDSSAVHVVAGGLSPPFNSIAVTALSATPTTHTNWLVW